MVNAFHAGARHCTPVEEPRTGAGVRCGDAFGGRGSAQGAQVREQVLDVLAGEGVEQAVRHD